MKHPRRIYFGLTVLSVAVTAVFLALMPDTVPMHYDAAGVADRFGSKYENLIFPLCTAGMALLFSFLDKLQQENRKTLAYTGTGILVFFNALFAYMMWQSLRYDTSAATTDINRFIAIAMGLLLILLGSVMPKMRRNSMVGLRTPWSTSNDTVWQKSQQFAGVSASAAGLLLCLLGAVLNGIIVVIALLAVLFLWGAVCTAASWYYYKREFS